MTGRQHTAAMPWADGGGLAIKAIDELDYKFAAGFDAVRIRTPWR
jgi:hypothetical protein